MSENLDDSSTPGLPATDEERLPDKAQALLQEFSTLLQQQTEQILTNMRGDVATELRRSLGTPDPET